MPFSRAAFGLLFAVALALPHKAGAQPARANSTTEARVLFLEGLTRAFLDDHEGAIGKYRAVLEQVPAQPAVLDALAESYAATDQLALALAAADEATRSDPANPFYALTAARIAQRRNDPSGAAARYDALLQRHPDQPQALDALATLYESRGARAEAAALLERLPATPEVLARLLGLYASLDADAAFLRAFDKLTGVAAPTAAQWRQLAAHHQRHGRPAEAQSAFEHALTRDPADRESQAALAAMGAPVTLSLSPSLAAYAAGHLDEAARLLQADLDRDPRDPLRWAQAAMAYLEKGDVDRARQTIEDGRLIFFASPPLLIAATYAALVRQDVEAAQGFLDEVDDAGDASALEQGALLLAEAALRHVQGRAAEAAELQARAFALADLGTLREAALAPTVGGRLADILP